MSTLKGEFDNAVKLPQGKLFWCVTQRRRSLSSAFPPLILLFYNEYLNIIVIYLWRLGVQLHWAIFRLISSQAGGWGLGRYIDLYMGGVMLEFVTALSSVPPRASFCCCLKSLVTFSGSSPQGCKIHNWPGFINHPVHFTQDVIGSAARGRVATCWLFFMLLCIASLWNQLPFNSVKPLQALMQLKAF